MPKPIVVVLGKASFRKSETDALLVFGRALAIRDKQLLTAKSGGALTPIIDGYETMGGTTQFLPKGTEAFDGRYPVVVFTDKRLQDQLDERMPDWRSRNWIVIHNIAETEKAGRYVTKILDQLGTPLPDGGPV